MHNYTRKPVEREFRIAIVGDSMTASINNAKPWPDVTWRYLNADKELLAFLGAKQITVLNLGVAGTSMQFMASRFRILASDTLRAEREASMPFAERYAFPIDAEIGTSIPRTNDFKELFYVRWGRIRFAVLWGDERAYSWRCFPQWNQHPSLSAQATSNAASPISTSIGACVRGGSIVARFLRLWP